MKFEYDEHGNIKLPEREILLRKAKKEKIQKAEDNSDKILLSFNEMIDNHECIWKVELPKNIPKKVLFEIKTWAESQYDVSMWIEGDETPFFIHVKGHKNRCSLCHTFLNGLNTKLISEFSTKMIQNGSCKYEFYIKDNAIV
jgi:hypothetical protein